MNSAKKPTHDSVSAQGYQDCAMPTGTFDKFLHMMSHWQSAISLLDEACILPEALLSTSM